MNSNAFSRTASSPFNAPSSPFAAQQTLGTAITTLPAASGCSCHQAVADGRTLIDGNASTVRAATDDTADSCAASETIAWQGSAASLFRQRMADCTAHARRIDDDAEQTRRMAWIGGA